jgi:hypothetical protein
MIWFQRISFLAFSAGLLLLGGDRIMLHAAKHSMVRRLFLAARCCLLIGILSALSPGLIIAASPLQREGAPPQIETTGDTRLLTVAMRDEQLASDGSWLGSLELQNRHALWYVVRPIDAAVPGAQLPAWVLLPPCRVKGAGARRDRPCSLNAEGR